MEAKWIWYPGDFELYHSTLLHARREEYDLVYPPMWHGNRPEAFCSFSFSYELEEEEKVYVYAKGQGFVMVEWNKLSALNQEVTLPAGKHDLVVSVMNLEGFPTIYINGPHVKTNETWRAHFSDNQGKMAAGHPFYTSETDDPMVFPFQYQVLEPVSTEEIAGGVLFDFGVENFGPVTLERTSDMGTIHVYYGESREEALDTEFAYLREHVQPGDGSYRMKSRAFRYLFVKSDKGMPKVQAELEFLPIEDVFSFTTDSPRLSQIIDISKRAFHLNTREFYLDGIKRDRWVWSGDAYQSYQVANYLYQDQDTTKRTIRALLGKLPYTQHINRINDYSAFLIIGVYEYYFQSGDIQFLKEIQDLVQGLYDFIVSRLDPETGYVVERPGDWIFIDWADMDKSGPLAAEQILLYQVYLTMEKLNTVLEGPEEDNLLYSKRAAELKTRILQDFWDDEKHAFIDCATSGKRNVTRQANVFAILYDFVDQEQKEIILKHVLENPEIPAITTPYFKLYELMAFGEMGKIEILQDYIDSYWGGMVDEGATSAWEQYDPKQTGINHYAMYGEKYGCSLCHAWGAGPILLLGRYVAGVRVTSVGSKTFEVVPNPGKYNKFDAVIPMLDGIVKVHYSNGKVSIDSNVSGGNWKKEG